MDGPLSSKDATSGQGSKENFIGRVVGYAIDSDDERFDTEYPADIDVLYEIEPLTKYEKNMYELGVNVRNGRNSKWVVFLGHMENIHGNLEEMGLDSVEDVLEYMKGRVYEFTDLEFVDGDIFTFKLEDIDLNLGEVGGDENRANPMMLPVRELTDEEVAEIGERSGDDDVDETVQL